MGVLDVVTVAVLVAVVVMDLVRVLVGVWECTIENNAATTTISTVRQFFASISVSYSRTEDLGGEGGRWRVHQVSATRVWFIVLTRFFHRCKDGYF